MRPLLQLFLFILEGASLATMILPNDVLKASVMPLLDYTEIYGLAATCNTYWNSAAGQEVVRLRSMGVHCTEPISKHVLEVLSAPNQRKALQTFCQTQLTLLLERSNDRTPATENLQMALALLEAAPLIHNLWTSQIPFQKRVTFHKILELEKTPPDSMSFDLLNSLVLASVFRPRTIGMGSAVISGLGDVAQIFVLEFSLRLGIALDFSEYQTSAGQSEVLLQYLRRLCGYQRAVQPTIKDILAALRKGFSNSIIMDLLEEVDFNSASPDDIRYLLRQEMSTRIWARLYELLHLQENAFPPTDEDASMSDCKE